jgi:hypothetical protein
MRKWLVLIDATILITALLVLVIDWQIKEDILRAVKIAQEAKNGPGSEESASVHSGISSVLRGDDDDNHTAVAGEDLPEKDSAGTRPATRNRTAKRSGRNTDQGIQGSSE